VNPAKNRLSPHSGWNDHFPLISILPFPQTNLIKIQDQFHTGTVNMMLEAFNRRVKKDPQHLKPSVFLWKTLRFPKLTRLWCQNRIDPSACNRVTESCDTLVQQFSFGDGRVIGGVLSDPGD
jgi:hypothetical protein